MRIRSIRPEFWSSEDVAALPWDTRLVFIGLWSYVDDNGVGRDMERLIIADLFPLDEDMVETSRRVHEALSDLATLGMISRYEVDGKRYLHVTNFLVHQRINRPSAHRYPQPPGSSDTPSPDGGLTEGSDTPQDLLSEDGVSPQPTLPLGEGEKGRSGEVEKGGRALRRATRIAEDFVPSEKAQQAVADIGYSTDELKRITTEFIDYWLGVPGQKGVKLDWDATWRNRVRQVAERKPPARALRAVGGSGPGIRPWM